MLFCVFVGALFCSSAIQAGPSISFFYPKTLTESTCLDGSSWTKWFNSAKPTDNGNLDQEVLAVIQEKNGHDVCGTPGGFQAQSVSVLAAGTSYGYSYRTMNNIIVAFYSTTPGTDYQVRFCCPNTDFSVTTTTTTTPRPLLSTTCGRAQIQNSLKAVRIFGGSLATANSWPWQVLYEEEKPCASGMTCFGVCGGTLIDSRHVLTAAHCIGTKNPGLIKITAGLHNKTVNEAATRQVKPVQGIFIHPNYNNVTYENDIAILLLSTGVQFNNVVQPACLPGPEPKPNADAVIIGWGATVSGGKTYNELKQARVKVIGDCNKYWPQVDEDKQICVANRETGDSACQGDSGGPMLCEQYGQWIVSGVTSFGSANDCTTFANSRPNVYTRVSAYLPWIQSILSV